MAALFWILFLGLICLSFGLTDISKMLERHPTWSFRLESLEAMLENGLKSGKPGLTKAKLQAKMDAFFGPNETHILNKVGDTKWSEDGPPETFDGRKKWPHCAKMMTNPSDEGSCGTDGPAMVASVVTDRLCVFRGVKHSPTLSPEILAGCAESCDKEPSLQKSLSYVLDHGLPTGGTYNSKKGCLPWTEPPCKHTKDRYIGGTNDTSATDITGGKAETCSKTSKKHTCPTKCTNPKYKKSFAQDFTRVDSTVMTCHFEDYIMYDIMQFGPVLAVMDLYDDFLEYPKGVYEPSPKAKDLDREKLYKIIGWGTENGVKYWLAVNSWSHWGSSKVFKIARPKDYMHPSFCVRAVEF